MNQEDYNNQANQEPDKTIRSIRKLQKFSLYSGPVSLLIGGVILGIAGLVCGLIAHSKFKQINTEYSLNMQLLSTLKQGIKVGIIGCCIAISINAASMYYLYPKLLEIMDNEGITAIQDSGDTEAGSPTITWG